MSRFKIQNAERSFVYGFDQHGGGFFWQVYVDKTLIANSKIGTAGEMAQAIETFGITLPTIDNTAVCFDLPYQDDNIRRAIIEPGVINIETFDDAVAAAVDAPEEEDEVAREMGYPGDGGEEAEQAAQDMQSDDNWATGTLDPET